MKLYQLLSSLDDSEMVRIKGFDCSWEMDPINVGKLPFGLIKDLINNKVAIYDSHSGDYSYISVYEED